MGTAEVAGLERVEPAGWAEVGHRDLTKGRHELDVAFFRAELRPLPPGTGARFGSRHHELSDDVILAVAVNGRVAAVARSCHDDDGVVRVTAMMPWETPVDGRNEVAGCLVAAKAPTARSITPAPSGHRRRTETGPGLGSLGTFDPRVVHNFQIILRVVKLN